MHITIRFASLVWLGLALSPLTHAKNQPGPTRKAREAKSAGRHTATVSDEDDELDVEPISFCKQPYESVCGEEAGVIGKRARFVESAVAKIKHDAMVQTAKDILKSPHPEKYQEIDDLDELKDTNNELRKKALKHWVMLTMKEFSRQSDLNEFLTQKQYKQILKNFQPGLSTLKTPGLKDKVNARLSKVKLVSASKFMKVMNPEDPELKKYLDGGYLGTCRYNRGDDNAFASSTEGEEQYFTPCPGLLLGAGGTREEGEGPEADTRRTQNAWVTAHELGHHFDSSKFPEMYTKLSGCLQKHYKAEVMKKDIAPYLDEITADYWATQALVEDLKTLPPAKRELHVVESLEFACDNDNGEDDEVHPPGRFRVEHIVRENPQIAELLGCEAPELTCTLEGEARPGR